MSLLAKGGRIANRGDRQIARYPGCSWDTKKAHTTDSERHLLATVIGSGKQPANIRWKPQSRILSGRCLALPSKRIGYKPAGC
jgi:hypothetical protein